MVDEARIETEILRLAAARGAGKSICPSEAARALTPEWQGLMTRVRKVAVRLAREGRIEILRKGKPVPPDEVRGVIRLRLCRAPDGPGQDSPAQDSPAQDSPGKEPEPCA